MRGKLLFAVGSALMFSGVASAHASPRPRALATKHTISVGAGLKKTGAVVKSVAGDVLKVVAVASGVSLDGAEAAVDSLGVALQAFADGIDLAVAAPLESLPEPIEAVGDGVHVVYQGLDKVGQFLAK